MSACTDHIATLLFVFFFFRAHWHVGILVPQSGSATIPIESAGQPVDAQNSLSMLSAGWLIGFIGW